MFILDFESNFTKGKQIFFFWTGVRMKFCKLRKRKVRLRIKFNEVVFVLFSVFFSANVFDFPERLHYRLTMTIRFLKLFVTWNQQYALYGPNARFRLVGSLFLGFAPL